MSSVPWKEWLKDQTPGAIKTSPDGTRASGYRRFRLAGLMGFARRCRAEVTIDAPHVIVSPRQPPSPQAQDGDDDDNDPWPEHMRPAAAQQPPNQTLHRKLLRKLETEAGKTKAGHCIEVMTFFDLPGNKVAIRCTTSLGPKHPVALFFRINECPISHTILNKIDQCAWVKSCYVTLAERSVQLKVIVV